jgi:WD40 repeat protein
MRVRRFRPLVFSLVDVKVKTAVQVKLAIDVPAHGADINALSWNRLEQHLLATGCEDGSLSVWDLRHFPRFVFLRF